MTSHLHIPEELLRLWGDPVPRNCALALAASLLVYWSTSAWRGLVSIPTIGGPNLPFLSYKGTFQLMRDGSPILQEGYDRYKGRLFKISGFDRWFVVVSGRRLLDELRRLPDDVMSGPAALKSVLEVKYTMGREVARDPYHAEVVRVRMAQKNLDAVYPDMRNEVVAAFDDLVPRSADEWVPIPAADTVERIVCRANNRAFFGLSLCRDERWLDLVTNYAYAVNQSCGGLYFLPSFLRPFLADWLSPLNTTVAAAQKHLEPLVDARRRKMREHGEHWNDKPNDVLMWLMNAAGDDPVRSSAKELTQRALALNFASLQTTSWAFTHALYTLAANPEYIQPLRDEVHRVVEERGWTRDSIADLREVDSFLKESMRISSSSLTCFRMALKPHTFSDGTYIPAGTTLLAPVAATHHDEELYPDPDRFLPARFAEKRSEDGESARHQLPTVSLDFISFGNGKTACPGRFYAANVMKTMLAHIVLNYDVKTEFEGQRPDDLRVGIIALPNTSATLLFRRRHG